jgi:hypothetical protein
VDWDAIPAGKLSLDPNAPWFVDAAAPALFRVPEERIVLIKPAHRDARRITATKLRRRRCGARVWA